MHTKGNSVNLYRKYRPKTIDQMIGNETELESFKNKIESKDPPHVFLFSGPSGCGKTTLARIAANMLGASDMSISEINSANNRGIDTAREIISQMQYSPVDGAYKVYIIDEVHQTVATWQNAMLKPLEDTPDHVFFFLCTTDPQKLLKALKNRCSIFKLSSLKHKEIFRLIRKVNKSEELKLSKDILEEIADASEGSPRKALVLLEKISGLEDENAIIKILETGGEENAEIIDLCRALLAKNTSWGNITDKIKGLTETDPEKIRWAVLGYMNSVLLSGKQNPRAATAIESFSEPFYNNGKSGVTLACYDTIFAE